MKRFDARLDPAVCGRGLIFHLRCVLPLSEASRKTVIIRPMRIRTLISSALALWGAAALAVVLHGLLDRFDSVEPAGPVERTGSPVIAGLRRVPVSFTRR